MPALGNISCHDEQPVADPSAWAWNDRHPFNPRPGVLTITTEQSEAFFKIFHSEKFAGNAHPMHDLAEDDPETGRDLVMLTTDGPVRIPPSGDVLPASRDEWWVRREVRAAHRDKLPRVQEHYGPPRRNRRSDRAPRPKAAR